MSRTGILTLSCPDRPGLVHAVSGYLVEVAANIVESHQFEDPIPGRFFMRVRFDLLDPDIDLARVRAGFAIIAAAHDMTWELVDATTPTRTPILVSKLDHCLNDLLYRARTGTLNIAIAGVVSNHQDLRAVVEAAGTPFHHVPVAPESKPDAERALFDLVDELTIDLVVLARYMQVLSNDACAQLIGRAINIHHSDEGPIIEQDVARVDHAMGPDELAAVGRDVEAQVLARAVKWHTERRVLLNGARTVVVR